MKLHEKETEYHTIHAIPVILLSGTLPASCVGLRCASKFSNSPIDPDSADGHFSFDRAICEA